MTGDRIPLRSVLLITVQGVQPVVAAESLVVPANYHRGCPK